MMKEADWRNWKWQMQNRVRSADQLFDYIVPTADELEAIERTRDVFRWTVTPYYASLMDPNDPDCPIRKQVVPRSAELEPDIVGVVDPLEEVAHSPVKNVIHNYLDRVAFCVTSECAIYCRYCLRKRMVGDSEASMNKRDLQAGVEYIASHPEIRDVLLTGGDPLTLGDNQLDWLLGSLRDIPHVQIIRIGTRMPVKLPYRIDDPLCRVLERHHPIWVNTHFNHPRELTEDASEALNRLLKAGVPVGNQTVLLRGINDNEHTLRSLCEGLVRMRVRPYYLYQAQVIGGTAHFRTSVEKGMEIMRALQGSTTGFAIPKYVLDTPFGKVPLNADYILGRAGDHVVMCTTRGRIWAEPNPLPDDEVTAFRLPDVAWPADAATISADAPGFVHLPVLEEA